MLAKPKSLIERISTALARGMPDNESTGCTVPELLKLLAECRDEITGNRQPEAEPVPQHTHDEIAMPEGGSDPLVLEMTPPMEILAAARKVQTWFLAHNIKHGSIHGLLFGDSCAFEVDRLNSLVESTQKLLAARVRETDELARDRDEYRAKYIRANASLELSRISSKDEAKRRIEKIEKHLNALKETING